MPRRNRVRRRRNRRNRRGQRRALNGGLIRGRMHPSVVSASPWNNYTCTTIWQSTDAGGTQCYVLSQLLGSVSKELGIGTLSINVRLTRADIWVEPAATGSDRNCVVFAPADWTLVSKCGVDHTLNWYEGWGTNVQPAHVHYVWPRSIATHVLVASEQDTVLLSFDCKGKTKYIVKLHIQWRASTPNPYSLDRPIGVVTTMREDRMSAASSHEFEVIGGTGYRNPRMACD